MSNIEEVIKQLEKNPQLRAEVIKTLARDYPEEYLGKVVIHPEKLKDVSAQFIGSDKEWQE